MTNHRRPLALVGAGLVAASLTFGSGVAFAAEPVEDCGDLTSTQVFLLRAQIEQSLVDLGGTSELTMLEAPYVCTHVVTQSEIDAAGGDQDPADDPDPTETPADETPGDEGSPSGQADELDCVDFSTREVAQAALDADRTDPHRLDEDNDGVACESHFGEPAPAVSTVDIDPTDDDDSTANASRVTVVPEGSADTGSVQ